VAFGLLNFKIIARAFPPFQRPLGIPCINTSKSKWRRGSWPTSMKPGPHRGDIRIWPCRDRCKWGAL